ncbi:hypothetical protein [Trueperella pyogenes]|uniref:hypothetical protein n=1 Tax=Trueperella pyogenes TaxID=1661 RepID=UPI001F0C3C9E|nr:hypothetical protein [Trueperella pyogenes]
MSILAFTPHKTGRKKLAQLLANHLAPRHLPGHASFAYQIADATLIGTGPSTYQMASSAGRARGRTQAGFETADPASGVDGHDATTGGVSALAPTSKRS